jgi:hypothetical protein
MLRILMAALAALTLTASPALAQRALEIDTAKGYSHPYSDFRMPGTLLGMPMTKLNDLSTNQTDVSAMYNDGGDMVSVYIYRLASGALPVWFDRAVWAIETRAEMFGRPERLPGAAAFVPPGQQTASGLTATWKSTKAPYRSTGLALIQMGEWMVKIRYSSQRLDAPQMAARVREIVQGLGWPRNIPAAPAAYEVAPCKTRLQLTGTAMPLKLDSSVYSAAAIAGAAEAEKPELGAPAPKLWCRDQTELTAGGVYRGDEEPDGYLIALSDAGRGLRVQPSAALKMLNQGPGWSLQFVDLWRTIVYPSLDGMPSPEQAIDLFNEEKPRAAFGTFGKDRQIYIAE